MITYHKIDGYENYLKLLKIIDCKGKILLHFCGSPNPLGNSWSEDCNESTKLIDQLLKESQKKAFHFVQVGVGSLSEWRKEECPFRTDEKLKLVDVPAIVLWRSRHRLIGKERINETNMRTLLSRI